MFYMSLFINGFVLTNIGTHLCIVTFSVLGFLNYTYLSICLKFLAENPSTKRKRLSSQEAKPSKKLKTPDTPGEDSGDQKVEKKRKKKKDSLGMPLSPTIWGHMQVSWLFCDSINKSFHL